MAGGAMQLQRPLMGLLALAIVAATLPSPSSAQLSVGFYASRCPSVFDTVRAGVRSAINRETRIGASLLRLFFHDCFVNGCDGSVLLEDVGSFVGERTAFGNSRNSIRGFPVIDSIKAQVDSACGVGVVSCADILAIAARDSVVELGGPSYSVPVGRRDARTASRDDANRDLPSPFEDLDPILDKFNRKGLTPRDMVALSGAHTVGFAQCFTFRNRIYNETNIDPAFATARQANCPATNGQGDSNLAPLDAQSPNRFGNNYFQALVNRRGLLHSDQVLFNGGSTDSIVTGYANNPNSFNADFTNAMVKMGNLQPLTGAQGEIRNDCKRVN
uniref:Peroxidase n=1 Tax=Anthurium amnicola TaxID=1678845 RepID=A0A1D1Y545_9ARAE